MRELLIALVGLVISLMVAERISVYVAQRRVARRMASEYDLSARLSVAIQGFPFLTQAVAGHYTQVDVALSSVTAGGAEVRDLRATFIGVLAPLARLLSNNSGTVTADSAAATALIPFASVPRRLPAGITLRADGDRAVTIRQAPLRGLPVADLRGVSLHVTTTGIEVSPRNVTVGGTLPVPPGSLGSRLAIALRVHDPPMHRKERCG
jgi:hypothetical protein